MVSEQTVRNQFAIWETDNPIPFFDDLPENITFKVCGSLNPLRGTYTSRDQVLETFGKLSSRFAGPFRTTITSVLVSGEYGIVEGVMRNVSKGGFHFEQEICWISRYEGDVIVEVRLYVDSAAEKAVMEEAE